MSNKMTVNKSYPKEKSELTRLVAEAMDWSKSKADAWMKMSNPHFGGASPMWMVMAGRGEKVREFIEAAKKRKENAHVS